MTQMFLAQYSFVLYKKPLTLENWANHFYMRIEIFRNLSSKHGDIAVLLLFLSPN